LEVGTFFQDILDMIVDVKILRFCYLVGKNYFRIFPQSFFYDKLELESIRKKILK